MSVATRHQGVHEQSEAAPRRGLEGPTRLWIMLFAAVIAVLLTGSLAAVGLSGRQSTAEHTGQATEALYRDVQALSSDLADADATVATALLVGPVTPATFTKRLAADVKGAQDLLADASQRVAEDPNASSELRLLAEQMPVYTELVGQALANNRFGYPVAGAYLRAASGMLTGEMLTEVGGVVAEQQNATTAGISSAASVDWPAIALCVLALVALFTVGRRIARSTRRRVNPGVLGAEIAMLALLGWTCAAAFAAGSAADRAQTDFGYVMQTQIGGSRLALTEAQVALQQIDRGENGATDRNNATTALAGLTGIDYSSFRATAPHLPAAVDALAACATQAIAQAGAGDYTQALGTTVGSGPQIGQGGCEAKVGPVREGLALVAGHSQQRYVADMSGLESAYAGAAALPLPLLAGLLGAVAAAWGIDRRLAEYR